MLRTAFKRGVIRPTRQAGGSVLCASINVTLSHRSSPMPCPAAWPRTVTLSESNVVHGAGFFSQALTSALGRE